MKQIVRDAMVTLAICAIAASAASAAGVLIVKKKKLVLLPRGPIAHVVVAPARVAPRVVYHAPPARAPARAANAAPLTTASLTPPSQPATSAQPAIVDGDKPTLVALTGDWSVFAASKDGKKTCFSATQPKDTSPRQANRAPAFVYLASAQGAGAKHELTIKMGFSVAAGSVTANVDGHDFAMATAGDLAYPPDFPAQRDLLQAMRHGHTLMLHAKLAGAAAEPVTDSISLLGIDDSLRMIDLACKETAAGP